MTEQSLLVDGWEDGKDMADRIGAVGIAQACADQGLGDFGEFG